MNHLFSSQVIAHGLWPLSLRMVEDMPAARGIIVSHQTALMWAEKFGRTFANQIRQHSCGQLVDK